MSTPDDLFILRAGFDKLADTVQASELCAATDTYLSSSDVGMSRLQYLEPLNLDSAGQRRTLEARFGGVSFRLIRSTLETGHAGAEILTADGHKRLKQLSTEFHRHPASSMRKHNPQKNAKIDRDQTRYKVVPGDGLCTDTIDVPSGPFPYY